MFERGEKSNVTGQQRAEKKEEIISDGLDGLCVWLKMFTNQQLLQAGLLLLLHCSIAR